MDRFAHMLVDVDAVFAMTARGLSQWADPHPDRSPLEEEYSRLLDPAKWRIIGARVDAWIEALVRTDRADVELDVEVAWVDAPSNDVHRVDRVTAHRAGTLPLVVTRNRMEGVAGAGVTVGAGDPAVVVEMIPDCGCDACDSGSRDVLEQVDLCIAGIVQGEFRQLTRRVERPPRPPGFWFVAAPPDEETGAPTPGAPSEPPFDETWAMPAVETITVVSAGRWSASGSFERGEVEAALADPTGWHEVSGPAWFGDDDT